MSSQITEAFVKDFRDGITLRAQQMESRIRPFVRNEGAISGTEASFDHVGKRRPTRRTSRHGDTVLSDTPHDRRWVTLAVFDDADLIDDPDKVRTLTDPTNSYSRTMAAGFGRLYDEIIMDAAGGTAKTGVDGTTTGSLDSTTNSGSDTTNNGMVLLKMTETKHSLASKEHSNDLHWAVTAKQIENMLNITELTSNDYAAVKALVQGEVDSFMGFMFHRVEDPILKLGGSDPTNDRTTFAWARENLLIGFGRDTTADIGPRRDKNNSVQVFYSADFGAVRMDDGGVVRVYCDVN